MRKGSRESDERILQWLRDRVGGKTCAEIAARHRLDQSAVRFVTDDVKRDDIAFGPDAWGDKRAEIRRAYW